MNARGKNTGNKESMLAACALLQRLIRSYWSKDNPESESLKVVNSLFLLNKILNEEGTFTYDDLIKSYGCINPPPISVSQEDNARYCIRKFIKEGLLKEENIEGSSDKVYSLQKEIPMENLIGKPGSLDVSVLKTLVDAIYYTSRGKPKSIGRFRDIERPMKCFEKAYSQVLNIVKQEKALHVRYSIEGEGILGTGGVATADGLATLLNPCWWTPKIKVEKDAAMNLFEGLKEFFYEEEGAFTSGEDLRSKVPIVDTNALALIALIKFRKYLIRECKEDDNYEGTFKECDHIMKKTAKWITGHQIAEGDSYGAWSQQDGPFFVNRPKSQATFYAALALSILPSNVSRDLNVKEVLERTLKFLKDHKSENGWGIDFADEPDPVTTAQFLTLLATMPLDVEPDEKALSLVETYLREKDLYSEKDIHIESIYLPDLSGKKNDGKYENIRSAGIDKWKTPKISQILLGLFNHYLKYCSGKIPESMIDPISDALNLIISSQEEGYWTVEEYGVSYIRPAHLYLNCASLYMRVYLDYSHAASVLGIRRSFFPFP